MKYEPVPLDRYFSLVPKTEADSDEQEQELRSIFSGQKRTSWSQLEEEFRCIILAEAGAGKTFEMEARARSDRELVERYLPFAKPKSEKAGDRCRVFGKINSDESVESENGLRVYLLNPLDENGIRTFATHRGISEVDRLILELQRPRERASKQTATRYLDAKPESCVGRANLPKRTGRLITDELRSRS